MSPSACRFLLYGAEYKSGDTGERERERKQESRPVDILCTRVGERASEPILAHISLSLLRGPFFLAACRPPSSLRRTNKLAHRELAGFCGSHLDLCTPPSRSLSPPLFPHRHLIQTLFTAEGGVFTITMRNPDGRRSPACVRLRPAHLFLFMRHPSRRVYNKQLSTPSNFEYWRLRHFRSGCN